MKKLGNILIKQLVFFKLGFTLSKIEQSLWGTKLQEKRRIKGWKVYREAV